MEDDITASSIASSIYKNSSASSSAIRFLGLLKQPDFDPSPFELDESAVFWPSSSDMSDSSNTVTSRNSPSILRQTFCPEKFSLSTALPGDRSPHVQRSAARAIPRSGPGSEELSGSGSGRFHRSAPVNVPMWPKGSSGMGEEKLGFLYEDDEDAEDEMVPPHEIVARSHMTTFSVFEGLGRTLKGRDLRRVRNAVWQKTGFLD